MFMNQARFLLSLFFIILFCHAGQAQILPVKNALQADLARVLEDYPNHFKNMLGELRTGNPQSEQYVSEIKIKDAIECTITKYSAEGKEIWSWEALMLQTDDFNNAEKKFRALYQSIQNLSVNAGSGKTVFKGTYEKPTEEKGFTSIVFKPGQENGTLKKLRVDLSIQNELLEWVVKVTVYDVEREAHEKGESLERKPF